MKNFQDERHEEIRGAQDNFTIRKRPNVGCELGEVRRLEWELIINIFLTLKTYIREFLSN